MVTKKKLSGVLLFAAALAGLNLAAAYVYKRIDLTREKRFTLHSQTNLVLDKVKQPLEVTVFLDGKLPAAFRRLRQATADLLTDYKAVSASGIKVIFTDPLDGLDPQQQDTVLQVLYQQGIEPTSLNVKTESGLTQKLVFPMALVRSGDRQVPVRLLQNMEAGGSYEERINNAVQNLEYVFTSAIRNVSSENRPRIAFSEGHGEPGDAYLQDAMKTLGDTYEVGRADLNQISREGLDKLKVLFIVKPAKEFSETVKYKLDYFTMRGGRIVWSLDQVSADLDSLKGSGAQLAFNNKLNLDDMLFVYGARVNYDLLADLNCAEIPVTAGAGGQGDIQFAPWIFYPVLVPDTSGTLLRNIDGIRTAFLSTVDTIAVKGIRKTVLLHSSVHNRVFSAPKLLSLQLLAEVPDPVTFTGRPRNAAVLLEGAFTSVFLNRAVPPGITQSYQLPARSKPTKMVVIGDGDVFLNQLSGRDGSAFPLGYDRYTQRNFGNKQLLLNLTDALAADDNLFELRSKVLPLRLLDKQLLRTEKTMWQLVNLAVPLLALLLTAIFQHYYRKYKYAR